MEYKEISTEKIHNSGATNQNLVKVNALRKSPFYRKVARKLVGKQVRVSIYNFLKKVMKKQSPSKKYPEFNKTEIENMLKAMYE